MATRKYVSTVRSAAAREKRERVLIPVRVSSAIAARAHRREGVSALRWDYLRKDAGAS